MQAPQGLLLTSKAFPVLPSPLSSPLDKGALLDTWHVLEKDIRVEAAAAACHWPALPDCMVPRGREEESRAATAASEGDFFVMTPALIRVIIPA